MFSVQITPLKVQNEITDHIKRYESGKNGYSDAEIEELERLGYTPERPMDYRPSLRRLCCFSCRLGNPKVCAAATQYALHLFEQSLPDLQSDNRLQGPVRGRDITIPSECGKEELIQLIKQVNAVLLALAKSNPAQADLISSPLSIVASADAFLSLLQLASNLPHTPSPSFGRVMAVVGEIT